MGLGVNPHSEDDRLPLLDWWSLTYTIHSIEWLLRDQGKPLFGSLSFCQDHCLSALTRCIANCIRIFDSQVVRSHCVRLLRYLLLGEHYLSSPHSVIEVDAFGLLVSLTMALPSLYMNEENSSNVDSTNIFGVSFFIYHYYSKVIIVSNKGFGRLYLIVWMFLSMNILDPWFRGKLFQFAGNSLLL